MISTISILLSIVTNIANLSDQIANNADKPLSKTISVSAQQLISLKSNLFRSHTAIDRDDAACDVVRGL
jgi:hypothetical protein